MSEKQTQIQEKVIDKLYNFFQKDSGGIGKLTQRFGKCRSAIELWKKLYKDSEPFILITYPFNTIEDVWKNELDIWKYSNPNIFYVNFRSLDKYKDFKPDFFCVDELHEASELQRDYCHQIMTNNPNTKTLALSGTISKETENQWGLPIIVEYSSEMGIEDQILANYTVSVHFVKLDTKIKTPNKKNKLVSEKDRYNSYSFVIEKMKKDGSNFMHLALARNRLSLSSIGKMNYLKKLLVELKDKRVIIFTGLQEVSENIGIPYFHSKSDNSGFEAFQKGEINHLALVTAGGLGVTYYNLDCVILLNFVGNPETTSQQLFRAIKLDYRDKCAQLIILSLDEKPEKLKLQESLSMLNKTKIKYVNN